MIILLPSTLGHKASSAARAQSTYGASTANLRHQTWDPKGSLSQTPPPPSEGGLLREAVAKDLRTRERLNHSEPDRKVLGGRAGREGSKEGLRDTRSPSGEDRRTARPKGKGQWPP